MEKLTITLLPRGPQMEIGTSGPPFPAVACNVISYWLYGPNQSINGIEFHITEGEGIVTSAIVGLSYVAFDEPYLRIWFTDCQHGERGKEDDWQGTVFYDQSQNTLIVTAPLTTLRESDRPQLICMT